MDSVSLRLTPRRLTALALRSKVRAKLWSWALGGRDTFAELSGDGADTLRSRANS